MLVGLQPNEDLCYKKDPASFMKRDLFLKNVLSYHYCSCFLSAILNS